VAIAAVLNETQTRGRTMLQRQHATAHARAIYSNPEQLLIVFTTIVDRVDAHILAGGTVVALPSRGQLRGEELATARFLA
jgi:hypothetical protein